VVDGASIYDRLREPKFHVVAFSDGTSDIPDMRSELEAAYPNLIDFHTVALYPPIAEAFDASEAFMVVLRPDNYIGLITGEVTLEKVAGYMEKVLRRGEGDAESVPPAVAGG
jgi:hypothetical protein